MGFSVFRMVEKFIQEKKIKRRHLTVFLCLALVVALTTTAALKLTGIAMTRTLTVLNCPAEIHAHSDSCYDGEGNLVCGYADFVVHAHTLDCYFDDVLTCELPVIEAHTHTEDCFNRESYLVCGHTQQTEPAEEGHVHGEDCYTEEPVLICELEESEEEDGHVHGEACYEVGQKLVCELTETDPEEAEPVHIHNDNCYKVVETQTCGKEEIILHTHTAACFAEAVFNEAGTMVTLVSQLGEDEVTPDTWTRGQVPVCGQLQIEEHIHGAGCRDTVELSPEEAEEFMATMDPAEPTELPGDGSEDPSGSALKLLHEVSDSLSAAVQKKSGPVWVVAGEAEPFNPGDDIRVDVNFATAAGEVQNGDLIVYQLPEILALNEDLSFPVTQNGIQVCTAMIDTDGMAAILLTDTVDPEVSLEGTLTVICQIREDADADGSRFALTGTEAAIVVGEKEPEPGITADGLDLTVRKENSGFAPLNDGSGKMVVTYTTTITTENGSGTELSLYDYFVTVPKEGKPFPEFGPISVTKNPGGVALQSEGVRTEFGQIVGTLPGLGAGESYVIQYSVTIDPANYDTQGGYLYLINHVDVAFGGDGLASHESGAVVQVAQVSADGEYVDGKFVWTIWVAEGNSGKLLQDIPDEGLLALIGSLSVDPQVPGSGMAVETVCSEDQIHTVTLDQLLSGYALECDGEHTFTFTTKPALEPGEGVSYMNGVHLGDDTDGNGFSAATGSVYGYRDNWSGTKETGDREEIGSEDGTKTVQEQLGWFVTVNFPDEDTWTDFTYTDSFRQTATGWFLQEDGVDVWVEDHPIHHYQILSRLDGELRNALRFWLAQADLEDDLTYTVNYKDQDGNEVTDGTAEVCGFEIRFRRTEGRNLHGLSFSFDYTTLVDTADFSEDAVYTVCNDFTLPEFTGTGSFRFQYSGEFSNEPATGNVTVNKVWLDVAGDPMTEGMPESVEMILKQFAFKGGIYLTEKPADPENWCKLSLYVKQRTDEEQHDVWIKSASGETLGTNTAVVWIPRNSRVNLSTVYQTSEDDSASAGSWRYVFNLKDDVSSVNLTLPVDAACDSVFLSIIGKAPAGFVPAGDFVLYGDPAVLTGDDNWSRTWEQLPLDNGDDTQYVYTVEEAAIPDGYYGSVKDNGDGLFTVTNRKAMEPGKITVDVQWVDAEGYPLVTHPDSVEVTLQKKVPGTEDEWADVANSTITLPNEAGEWTASWTGLEEGEYRVVEKMPAGFAVSYTYVTYDSEGNKYSNPLNLSENAGFVTVTNIETIVEDGEIIVIKVWEYEDGTPDTEHPDSIKITIRRAKKQPVEENEPDPTEPSGTEPTEPSGTEPTEPSGTEPTEPSGTEPTEPSGTEPTEPSGTEPTEPSGTEPTEPSGTEPTEPSGTEPTEPSGTEPTEPSGTEPTEPSGTEPTEPSGTEPTEPSGTEPTKPTGTNPTKPNPSEPTSPKPGTPSKTGDDTVLLPSIFAALISGIMLLAFAMYGLRLRDRRKR